MSRFIKKLSMFVAGVPLLLSRTEAAAPNSAAVAPAPEPGAVPLRPLNFEHENLFAGHRSHSSHSSHASHSSHYSGSGGGHTSPSQYSPSPSPAPQKSYPSPAQPLTTAPAPPPAPNHLPGSDQNSNASPLNSLSNGLAPGANSSSNVQPGATPSATPALTLTEKRRLQVMRVQMALTSLGLYSGPIDGVLNSETKLGLEFFQDLKHLPKTGTMTTPTLNALGVPAVN